MIHRKLFNELVAIRLGVPPQFAARYIDAIIDEIGQATSEGQAVCLKNFGTFRRVKTPAYFRPVFGETKHIPEREYLSFRGKRRRTGVEK